MLQLPYNGASIEALKETLLTSHTISIRLRLLDLDHGYLQDLTAAFTSGQINFDVTQSITRSMDVVLFDPLGSIHLDPNSPSPTGVYITNMISVVYVVLNPVSNQVWEVPVFCGPIDKVDRDTFFINVKCLGKEALSINNLYRAKQYRKGQKKTTVIRSILVDLCGETKLSIPDRPVKMPNDLHMNQDHIPIIDAKNLAASMGYQLFYDGRGVARMRPFPRDVIHNFTDNWLTSTPRVSYDLSQVRNAIRVVGKKPKKAKNRITYDAVAQRAHTLSPWELGRGNPRVPRFLWEKIEDDNINSRAEAVAVGNARLAQGLLTGVDATFDGRPLPLIEEMDVLRLASTHAAANFQAKQWTLPLVAGDSASYGYFKRVLTRGRTIPKRGGKTGGKRK